MKITVSVDEEELDETETNQLRLLTNQLVNKDNSREGEGASEASSTVSVDIESLYVY